MKNYEKYKDKLVNYNGTDFCSDFIMPIILEEVNCNRLNCGQCFMLCHYWLHEEYEESEIDWSKVAIDTPILVKSHEENSWYKRHFAKYEAGKVYAWSDGCTSWTAKGTFSWKYAKLAEVQDGTD